MKISGGNAVRLFTVTNASFAVSGLTLADGYFVGARGADGNPAAPGQDIGGACILNQGGTVSLTACTLTNHIAQGGYGGLNNIQPTNNLARGGNGLGGAICSFGGQVNLTNCLVAGNATIGGLGATHFSPQYPYATLGNGGQGLGGAVYLAGSGLNLQGATLTNNRAAGGFGQLGTGDYGSRAGDASGGALYATTSWLYASSSVLANNTAIGGTWTNSNVPWASYADGGGGDAHGGALFLAPGSLGTFSLCSCYSNSALAGLAYLDHWHQGAPAGGGAIFNAASFYANGSTFSGNSAKGSIGESGPRQGQGGGVFSTNMLVTTGCTFYNNLALGGIGASGVPVGFPSGPGEGGGVWSSGVFCATNCTWATNVAQAGSEQFPTSPLQPVPASGGAICITGGSATLVNVTLAGNWANGGVYTWPLVPSQGGGVMNTNGTVLILNSILANSPCLFGSGVYSGGSNVWGVVTDGGYNLSSDTTGGFTNTGSLMNTDPMLAPLANYGGPTLTLWLLPGSPARDRIPAGYPPTDQRGALRPQGPAADIGAVEADNPPAASFTLGSGCSGTNLTLSCAADDWRAYRLLRSTDLVTWTAIATNSSDGCGKAQFVQPATGLRAFYRVVTP